jgi:hypothetical protein
MTASYDLNDLNVPNDPNDNRIYASTHLRLNAVAFTLELSASIFWLLSDI